MGWHLQEKRAATKEPPVIMPGSIRKCALSVIPTPRDLLSLAESQRFGRNDVPLKVDGCPLKFAMYLLASKSTAE